MSSLAGLTHTGRGNHTWVALSYSGSSRWCYGRPGQSRDDSAWEGWGTALGLEARIRPARDGRQRILSALFQQFVTPKDVAMDFTLEKWEQREETEERLGSWRV